MPTRLELVPGEVPGETVYMAHGPHGLRAQIAREAGRGDWETVVQDAAGIVDLRGPYETLNLAAQDLPMAFPRPVILPGDPQVPFSPRRLVGELLDSLTRKLAGT